MSNDGRQAEARGFAEFEYRGKRFKVPTDHNEWSLDLHEALEDGKEIALLRAALGPQQWAQVKAMNLKTPDINEFAQAAVSALGFRSVGESSASAS